MKESTCIIAGLATQVIEAPDAKIDVVLLHGYAMQATDLTPFAHSLGVAGNFFVPNAPLTAEHQGNSWWTIDEPARRAELTRGPRDLVTFDTADRASARQLFMRFCSALPRELTRPLFVCGFSQGGMVACDAVLCGNLQVDGLALLSSSRVAIDEWQLNRSRVKGLPILISHGRHDPDLAFSAGEALRDFHTDSGAEVNWVPFEGAHEIPLSVWRQLRHFLRAAVTRRAAAL